MLKARFVFAAALLLGIPALSQLAYAQFMGSGTGSPLSPYGAMHQGSNRAGINDLEHHNSSADTTRILTQVRHGLQDVDPTVRVQELKKLRYLRSPEVDTILISSLSDPDIRVRIKAVDVLGAREANDAVGPMSQLLFLRSTEPIVRLHVVAALGRIGDARGALPVMQYLKEHMQANSDPRARGTAVFALGEIGNERATALLTEVANQDHDQMVRRLAQEALAKIGGEIPTEHARMLARRNAPEPTDQKLAKLRAYEQKVKQMER